MHRAARPLLSTRRKRDDYMIEPFIPFSLAAYNDKLANGVARQFRRAYIKGNRTMKQIKKSGRKLAHSKKQSTHDVWTLIPVPAQTRREVEKLAQMRGEGIGDTIAEFIKGGIALWNMIEQGVLTEHAE